MKLLLNKTISKWKMTGILSSGARWFFGLSVLTANTDNQDSWVLKSEYDKVVQELENERMRLVACGVVAMADTRESAVDARNMLPEYNSASCQDVARKVDELLDLREELAVLKSKSTFSIAEVNEVFTPELDPLHFESCMYIEGQQYIVCAAARNTYNGAIICSPRHYDSTFYAALELYRETADEHSIRGWREADQGFVDQFGKFLTRAEARRIAVATGQIRRRCGGDHEELYSENLY